MLEVTRTATFTDAQPDEALTTIVARSVLEAALADEEPGQLWFEVESEDDSRRLAIDISTADLEELLRLAGSDDLALTLDADEVGGLFDDPDVEGHGMKGAIAIAVTSAALLAPAGQAAVTQTVGTQATTQRADVAATTQIGAAVSTQVSNAAATAQVATVQAKLAKSNVTKLRSLKLLRGGLAR
ncbi:MAG TPA: hypothetical protein VFT94_03315 [Gaiellaceae bacterium]|nr:hypothetical protein [Gaiellaceae bacterium]